MIVIVDYGMGNLHSIKNKIERLKHEVIISADPLEIQAASRLILPGVGHFAQGMENLHQLQLIEVLNEKVLNQKTPVLGICLGMQLLTNHSEEGDVDGLKWIDAETRLFRFDNSCNPLRIPHVGWNLLNRQKDSYLFTDIPFNLRFYFVHSYYVNCRNPENIMAETTYGNTFCSVIQHYNIYGTQFHPEKSHKRGLQLIDNFIRYSDVASPSHSLPAT
ncbi:MAG: imidazole glycerol phosphate synthase subunit HisH [SAR324 cluster bacterium]|nr:imidazole glycerol phosphate synthase subunit HisH [SAR324 cluster bacterium]